MLEVPRWQRILLASAAIAALVLTTFGITRAVSVPDYPGTASADAGFARDMQAHHAQAVQMSMLIQDRSSNEQVLAMAYDIALTQQHQIGQMHSWLEQWNLPQTTSAPPMAWMQSDEHRQMNDKGAMTMPGMAPPRKLDQLQTATGQEADRLYLSLMIDHHRGGVAMAKAALQKASTQRVHDFAQKLIIAQTAEINAMKELLNDL